MSRTSRLASTLALLLAAACQCAPPPPECVYNSDCTAPEVCVAGACGAECKATADCADGYACTDGSCVREAAGGDEGCVYNSDCEAPLACVAATCRAECVEDGDCVDGYLCVGSRCRRTAAPTGTGPCANGIRDGDETDVDCGGACADCAPGSDCAVAADCASGSCAAGRCLAATCSDSQRNGSETDVDCGGPACNPCLETGACVVSSDCVTGLCSAGACEGASCSDGVQNDEETDIDCGGTCAKCDNTRGCAVSADCLSGVCVGASCRAPSCADGLRNGYESGVDCGGSTCAACPAGRGCVVGGDCASGRCTDGLCQASTCGDGVKNGSETGADCGGPSCGPCADGLACVGHADCGSGACVSNACVPTFSLTISAIGAGGGRVVSVPAGIDCGTSCTARFPGGTSVTLTATPAANSTFVGWDGGGCSGSGDCAVTVGDATTVSAEFGATETGAAEWDRLISGASGSNIARAVAVDGDGAVAFVGYARDQMEFGGGPLNSAGYEDLYVGKYTRTGDYVWARRFGSAGGDIGYAVATNTQGDIFVAGTMGTLASMGGAGLLDCNSSFALAKYDGTDGTHLWSKCVAAYALTATLRITPAGDAIVVGSQPYGTSNLGGGTITGPGFAAKFSGADGAHVWSKGLPGPAQAGALDPQGNVLVTGYFQGTAAFGSTSLQSIGSNDVFVAKLGPTGTVTWARSFGDSFDDQGRGIAADSTGAILVTGYFHGTVDFGDSPRTSAGIDDVFLLKLSPAGAHVWSKRFGGPGSEHGAAVAIGPADTVSLGVNYSAAGLDLGSGVLPFVGGWETGLARYTSSGALLWTASRTSPYYDQLFGLTVDRFGSTIGCGYLESKFAIYKHSP